MQVQMFIPAMNVSTAAVEYVQGSLVQPRIRYPKDRARGASCRRCGTIGIDRPQFFSRPSYAVLRAQCLETSVLPCS
ncbi:hypothetical protein SKAU_G00252360 [Synaphobranchus kaupii]|uniref:Uncharacterized protein n=1 Tax=Synaphobranchus kaupii TaxID=118154 RepID=A0A9Q1IR29_SYNKA|nr:hypothetical protein SKAU_G00252360 [Synaphobranchus kaupii]